MAPVGCPNRIYLHGAGAEVFPFAVNNEPPANIQTRAQWPYVQQWHLDYQFELPGISVGTSPTWVAKEPI